MGSFEDEALEVAVDSFFDFAADRCWMYGDEVVE